MKKQALITTLTSVSILLGLAGTAKAAFLGRLAATPGGTDYQAYYDTQLDITWLADANAGAGSAFDNGGFPNDGRMTLANASAWAVSLNIDGVTGWRLPSMDRDNDNAIAECSLIATSQLECSDNEYGHLYYFGAGATRGPITSPLTVAGAGISAIDPGPFSNVQGVGNVGVYWSSTVILPGGFAPGPWNFTFSNGFQSNGPESDTVFAWAVHDGDISAVPLPVSVWLFSSGLLGLVGFGRRKA